MKPIPLTTLAALVAIGAGCFIAGRISSSPAAKTVVTGPSANAPGASSMLGAAAVDGPAASHKGPRPARSDRHDSAATPADRLAKLEAIIRGENPLERNRALLAYLDQLGPGEFEGAVAHFRELGITDTRLGEYALLMSAWAETDPMAALAYTTANVTHPFATNTVLATWAARDPEAAIRWAEAQHEGEGANPYLAGIIRGLAPSDPQRASQLLTAMPRSVERGQALDAFMPHLIQQGAAAARSWIDGLSDDALRNGAMLRAADRLAASDPAGTAAWLLAQPNEATRTRLDNVYSQWVQQDSSAAMASLAALPSGEDRSNALRGAVSSIASQDPHAAVELMNRYPGDVTDRVVQNFVWHSFDNDPATAVEQVGRITDADRRDRMYGRVLATWLDRDATAAAAWMQRNPVSPAVQERLNRR